MRNFQLSTLYNFFKRQEDRKTGRQENHVLMFSCLKKTLN